MSVCEPVLIRWIFSFLTDRPQQVRVGQTLSVQPADNQHRCPSGMCAVSGPLRPVHSRLPQQRRRECDGQVRGRHILVTGLIQEDDSSYREAVEELPD